MKSPKFQRNFAEVMNLRIKYCSHSYLCIAEDPDPSVSAKSHANART